MWQREVNESGESLSFNLPLLLCWEMEVPGDNAVTLLLQAWPVIVLQFPGERQETCDLSSCTNALYLGTFMGFWENCPPISTTSDFF